LKTGGKSQRRSPRSATRTNCHFSGRYLDDSGYFIRINIRTTRVRDIAAL
jgi:hypothetical protein